MAEFDVKKALESARLNPLQEIEKPPTIIAIGGKSCMTAGAFSVIIGRPKARKGFTVGSITVAAASGSCTIKGIKGFFNDGKKGILYFDTEQGAYWGQVAHKRIIKAIGNDQPKNLQYYNLQQYTPAQRLQMIDTAIMEHPNLLMVVIDGIRDLISSINDESQATETTSHILRWCATKQIHVICLLHMNKNDFNARGHIGSELINKAETVISITKEKDENITTVKHEFCRDMEFTPFSFIVDDDGLPRLTDTPKPEKPGLLQQRAVFETILPPPRILPRGMLVAEYMARTNKSKRTADTHINSGIENKILVYDEATKGYKLFQLLLDEGRNDIGMPYHQEYKLFQLRIDE